MTIQSEGGGSDFWRSLPPWQRRRLGEAAVLVLCAWYTTFSGGPDLPHGPIRIEFITWLGALGVAVWWLLLALLLLLRAGARRFGFSR